jgi:hypothetical protein
MASTSSFSFGVGLPVKGPSITGGGISGSGPLVASNPFVPVTTFNPQNPVMTFPVQTGGIAGGILGNPTVLTFPIPTPTPPSPTATASDLQIMISAIPIAQDGHVITADYHNALRLALVAIANRLGIGPVAEEITITNAPRLSPVVGAVPWDHDYGLVKRPGTTPTPNANVRGWMEMELPDGARIKKMMVFGTVRGIGTLKVKLKRQKVTDPTVAIDLIVIDIPTNADATKGVEGELTVPSIGAGAAAIEEFRLVNNREHKYLLSVELDGINSDSFGQFHSVQVVCGR